MMLTQNSLPSSTEATKSFVSDHGKEEFLCDWKCAKCNRHSPGCCSPVMERRNNDGDSCSLNFARNCSQLSTISCTISEGSTPFFVYQRRKWQRNSAYAIPAQVSANAKASDNNGLSPVSTEAPSMATKEHLDSQVDRAPLMLPLKCNGAALLSKSGSIDDGCSLGDEPGSVEDPKDDMQKVVDSCCINDSCSSSKSSMDLCLASLETLVDDTGECSSSGALTAEGLRHDLSEKDICISILRREGVLEGVRPIKVRASAEGGMGITSSDSRSCSRSCKACDRPETTLKMLICDHCEEAFHVSCCNPRVKRIPGDEWFCNSCLKKKHKILKETTTSKSADISSDMGRSRSATNGALGPVVLMLKDKGPYRSNVRVGKDFQAEVPDWSGPILNGVDNIVEPLGMNPSECCSFQDWIPSKSSRLSSIGNWLQCRAIIDGVGEGVNGTICGKWRRAPLFEVQSDDWECFRSFIWDPTQSDCAVPQELDTDQVLKQLKYIEMLRPRLAAKRRKLDHAKSVESEELADSVRNTQTTT